MAYREVAMWEILTVLQRIARGETVSAVARLTGHSRVTVRRYVDTARELGWEPGEDPTEQLAAELSRRLRPAGLERSPGETEGRLLPHRDRIEKWLKPAPGEKRGLRLTKVHRLLTQEGIEVPYSSLHRFAVKHCRFSERQRITVRVAEPEPGELAEVDFGRLGPVADPETGRKRLLWALSVVLVFSRHQYVHVTHSQKIPDLIAGLEDAWEFFGGVVRRLIIDNLRAAITRADRYEPIFQRTFEEYARHRGFIIDATRPRHATGKPHVERGVSYLRENFFRGEDWQHRDHVQREAVRWCLQVAGTRVHGTTRKRPLAVFENVERAALQSLTAERFDPPRWAQCTVHPDHHISFEKALYSVPTRFIGKRVWVRADSKLVRLYFEGRPIKTHPRKPPGSRSTDYNDYPQELSAYALRDPQRLIRQARKQGIHIGRFAQALLAGDFPWARLRQAQKLLRLGEKYGWARLDLACRRALAFELINVRRLEAILRQDLEALELPSSQTTTDPQILPLRPRFQRPARSFSHQPPNQEVDHDRGETLS